MATVGTSDIKICSSALLRLGAKAISSFADGSNRSTLCANIYPSLKEGILSGYDWRFTVKKRQLNRNPVAPINEWQYEFTLPSNRITDGPIAVFNSDTVGALPINIFELFAASLHANDPDIYIDYQTVTAEQAWPAYFIELMTKAMMVELAYPITDQANLRDALDKEVYGTVAENRVGGMMRMTRSRNAREDPPMVFTDYSLINARFAQ